MSLDANDESFLTCPVCLDMYTDPRTLPCLHTLCWKCLVGIANNNEDMLKPDKVICPECREKHEIQDHSLVTFRKDFRIQNLVEKAQKEKNMKEESNICENHDGYKKRFYCKNEMCLTFICQECWSEDHADHDVVILSKVVEKLREDGQKQTDVQDRQLQRHIQRLLVNKEYLDFIRPLIEDTIKMKIEQVEKQLKALERCALKRFDDGNKTISDELNKLFKVQEKLDALGITFKESVDENNVQNAMRELNNSKTIISEWALEIPYTHVKNKLLDINKILDIDHTSRMFGTQEYSDFPQEDENRIKQEKQEEQLFDSHNANHVATKRTHWIIDGPSKWNGFCISVKYPDVLIKSSITVNTAERSLDTLALEPRLQGSQINQEIQKYQLQGDRHADCIGTIVVDDIEYLVELDKEKHELRFSAWDPENFSLEVSYIYKTEQKVFLLACDKDSVIYSFLQDRMVTIKYIRVCQPFLPKEKEDISEYTQRTLLDKHRALCLLREEGRSSKFVVTNVKSPHDHIPMNNRIAVRCVSPFGMIIWDILFRMLDRKAQRFDLRSMATDGNGLIFILDKFSGIFVVSKHGVVLKKLVTGHSIS